MLSLPPIESPIRDALQAQADHFSGLVMWATVTVAAGVALEVLLIGGVEERALVVIEPPGEARVAGVLEIDDGVLVAIEQRGVERLRRGVGHARIAEYRVRVDSAPDKAAEEGSRGRSVETVIVIEDAYQHGNRGKTYQLA